MSTELQTVAAEVRFQDLSPEYAEIMVLGKVLQMSGYFTDVRDQAQAVTKILYGREFGLSPIISMSSIHVIEGKPTLASNLLAALIKRSGKYNYRVKEWDNEHCILIFKEKIEGKWEEVGEASFSIEDAKIAKVPFTGRNGGATGWTKYPKAMLFARALSQGERTYCPDVSICPLYVPEELGATVNESGEVVDLPASAKPIAVVAEPKTFTRPAAVQDSGGKTPAFSGKGTPEAPNGSEHTEPTPPERQPGEDDDTHTKPLAEAILKKITIASEPGMIRNFGKSFREALPKHREKDQDELRHQWLGMNFFMDKDGNPASESIPKDEFEKWKAKACAWAKEQ